MGLRAFIGVGGWFLQGVCTLLGAANTALAEQEGGGSGSCPGGCLENFQGLPVSCPPLGCAWPIGRGMLLGCQMGICGGGGGVLITATTATAATAGKGWGITAFAGSFQCLLGG